MWGGNKLADATERGVDNLGDRVLTSADVLFNGRGEAELRETGGLPLQYRGKGAIFTAVPPRLAGPPGAGTKIKG